MCERWTIVILGSIIASTLGVALQAAPANGIELKSPLVQVRIASDASAYEINDVAAGVTWRSNPLRPRLGEVTLNVNGKRTAFDLRQGASQFSHEAGAEWVRLSFQPMPDRPDDWVAVKMALQGPRTIEFSYDAAKGVNVESIRLLDDALPISADEKGYVLVPVREGLLVPADSGLAFMRSFGTYEYEGCHMAMLGLVKNGAATLVTWDDPYATGEIRSTLPTPQTPVTQQTLSTSMVLRKSARSFKVTFLGKGDYMTVANAYRQVAKEKGWLVTWDQKLKENPHRAALFGASNIKLWSTLSRTMDETSTKEQSVRVNWTFDEVGQVAEHFKNDLKLDDVHFIIGGWIHRGYDNQHPDILPAAPECGGNDGLAAAAKRVKACGYIFDLHDNYQDMYKDAPSWDEQYLQKLPNGQPARGGKWAGGVAWLTCSQKALELAQRPQNLEAVKKLTDADAYFIDTTYAAGLQECYDPKHPETRLDDMKWKQALSDYARSVFGIFGSECGREWAIPHADYFEGLTGVSGTYYHNLKPAEMGATVVPLFEMVYRDCIAMYGKYGYNINNSAEYVIHHISIGRTLNYHSVPSHLYWQTGQAAGVGRGAGDANAAGAGADPAMYVRADAGWASGLHPADRFIKNTHEILSPLNKLTSQMRMTGHEFLTPDRKVRRTVFGEGAAAVTVVVNGGSTNYACHIDAGGDVLLPPYGFVVSSPSFAAFCALSWNGLTYEKPTLFTIRSLDGLAAGQSRQLHIFHGFGDARVKVGATEYKVDKEMQ